MKQFVFPAIFMRDEDNDTYIAAVPDLGLSTEGDSIEEAFLFIKYDLKIFCEYALTLKEDILWPTTFEKTVEENKNKIVMLIDAIIQD